MQEITDSLKRKEYRMEAETMEDMTVWAIRTENVRRLDLSGLEALMPQRMEKAKRFRFEKDRLLCIGAGYLMIQALGIRNESVLRYGANGKPFAPGYSAFSLSHSGQWCVLACGPQKNIGVDIEQMQENCMDVAPAVYTQRELAWMAADPVNRFFRLWTWKESVMKATGMGMSLAPQTFEVLPFSKGHPVFLQDRAWYARGGDLDGYSYSVCSDEPIGQLRWTEITNFPV